MRRCEGSGRERENEGMWKRGKEGRKGEMKWREEGEKEGGEVRREKGKKAHKQTRIIVHVFSE